MAAAKYVKGLEDNISQHQLIERAEDATKNLKSDEEVEEKMNKIDKERRNYMMSA